jgi:hypothetical protein
LLCVPKTSPSKTTAALPPINSDDPRMIAGRSQHITVNAAVLVRALVFTGWRHLAQGVITGCWYIPRAAAPVCQPILVCGGSSSSAMSEGRHAVIWESKSTDQDSAH